MLVPPDDRVLLREVEPDQVTAFGLELPETAQQPSSRAIVLAVGRGSPHPLTGELTPLGEHRHLSPAVDGECVCRALAPGDVVVLPKYGGTTITYDDEEIISILVSEILAVVA